MQPNQNNNLQRLLEDKTYFLEETASMTQSGSYSGNITTGAGFIDEIGRKVLNIPDNYEVNLFNCLRFFKDEIAAKQRFIDCMQGGSFELDIYMKTFDNKPFWARATGKPLENNAGEIVGIRGVFTSIDRFVLQNKEVLNHARIINAQRDRLLDFAHIVSHNLRSHASNLQLTIETFDELDNAADVKVFKNYLQEISGSINQTLSHLNQVVTTHTIKHKLETLNLTHVLDEVLNVEAINLKQLNVVLNIDFSDFVEINYVKPYLISIYQSLISNAIAFRNEHGPCIIDIRTKLSDDKMLLIIRDNGSGIDLEKNGNRIFKMYQTFHEGKQSLGIGLFVLKNQIESLDGDITVKSKLGIGTSFTIRF